MRPRQKVKVIQEIIRPLKTKKLFSVSLKIGSNKIYLGDFDTIQKAHKEFKSMIEIYRIGTIIPYELKFDPHLDNFSFENTSSDCQSLTGVSKTRSGKFQATIMINKRRINLGCFKTPEEAHETYMVAKQAAMFNPQNYSPFPFIQKILESK